MRRKGWFKESYRHMLSARGIKTNPYKKRSPRPKKNVAYWEGNKMKFFAEKEKGKGIVDFLNEQPEGIVTLKESQIAKVQGDAMRQIQDAIDRQETDPDGKTAPTIESGAGARMMDDVARESEWYRTETTNERGYDDYKRRVKAILDHGLSKNNTTFAVFTDLEQQAKKMNEPSQSNVQNSFLSESKDKSVAYAAWKYRSKVKK